MEKYISYNKLLKSVHQEYGKYRALRAIYEAPKEDVVSVDKIKEYLQEKLNEWHSLGDRKFEPENVLVYNFIISCFDDLEKYVVGGDK
jgi:hypothetical protein